MISKARHVVALPWILQKSLSAPENEFLASCLKTCSSLQATEALLALLAWAWSLQDTHYAWLSGAESTRAFAAVMWPHWHYTQLSISYFVSHINRAEGCEAAWRSFDNWELYKFSNPQRRIGGCFFSSFFFLLLCIFVKPRRPHRGGDKSFDINHCVMFSGKAKSSGDWLLIA